MSKEYSNFNKAVPQHPTIAEELEAVSNSQRSKEDTVTSNLDRDRSQQPKTPGRYGENMKSGEGTGLSTIIEHQASTSNDQNFGANGILEGHRMKESSRSCSASVGQRPSNIAPNSPILELSESISSHEGIETNSINSYKECNRKKESEKSSSKPVDRRDLYKRMASDTDLWMSIKSRPSKFQSNLEATKETSDSQSVKPSKFLRQM